MKSRLSTRMFSLLVLLVLFAGALPLVAAQEPVSKDKIEQALLDEFNTSESGTANFFVVMDEQADLSAAYKIDDWDERGWYVYNTLTEVANRTQAPVVKYLAEHNIPYRSFYTINTVYIRGGSMELASALATIPSVQTLRLEGYAQIDPNAIVEAENGPEAYGWNLDTLDPGNADYGMQAAQVWDQYGIDGDGIVVANIDTGAYYQHEALVEQYRGNLGGGTFEHNYNWYDPTGTYPTAPGDNNSHGSGTIGIMAGQTPDLTEQIGVAPGSQWIACKGCASNSCYDADLIACADFI
ncbi:MAG: S8 family serine peptidase, partial [Chloroflexia bacterium]|nr:S8 family serine peptidase [Chloroflexia bacterium]